MRKRKRDWPQRVYKFWARPIGDLPPELWWTANRMQGLWNQLADRREQVSKEVELLPETPERAAQRETVRAAMVAVRERIKAESEGVTDRQARKALRQRGDAEIRAIKEEARRTRTKASGPREERWHEWNAEIDLIAKTSGLSWEQWPVVVDRFATACRMAPKRLDREGNPGWPRARRRLDKVMIPHRYTGGGEPISALFSDRAKRLSLRSVPADAYASRRDPRRLTKGRFGLTGDTAINLEVLLHRPIPKDAIVKGVAWVGVVDSRERWEWALTVTVEEPPVPIVLRPGRAAVALGWEHVTDRIGDYLRVGTVVSDSETPRDILLPLEFRTRQQHRADAIARRAGKSGAAVSLAASPDQLSYYDERIAAGVEAIKARLKEMSSDPVLTPALAGLTMMRQGGLVRLLRYLEKTDAAPAARELLTAWLATHERFQSIRRAGWQAWARSRQWRYANAAMQLCATHGTIALAKDFDLKRMAQIVGDDPAIKEARKYRQWAGVSELRAFILRAAAKTGTRVVLIDASSPGCMTCGSPVTRDGALTVACTNGHRHDRKVNTASHMLRALKDEGDISG